MTSPRAKNCWSHLDTLKNAGERLKTDLDILGWSLLEPTASGEYRARKCGAARSKWNEVTGPTPQVVLERVQAEISRHNDEKREMR